MRIVSTLALLTFGLGHALAMEGGDPAAGRAIAEAKCSVCHAIGKAGASPNPAAPPFRSFSSKWPVEDLAEALGEGLSVGHSEMPEFIFEESDIGDLIAFLLSIQDNSP
jgi:mono/diheme cytochrome c family protein